MIIRSFQLNLATLQRLHKTPNTTFLPETVIMAGNDCLSKKGLFKVIVEDVIFIDPFPLNI